MTKPRLQHFLGGPFHNVVLPAEESEELFEIVAVESSVVPTSTLGTAIYRTTVSGPLSEDYDRGGRDIYRLKPGTGRDGQDAVYEYVSEWTGDV